MKSKVKAFEESDHFIEQKAKFLSIKKGEGILLGAIPSRALGTALTNQQWITTARLRLGMHVMKEGKRCECCGMKVDGLGKHALSCSGKGGGMWNRHEAICKCLMQFLKYAEIPAKWDKSNLIRDSQQRPADIFLPDSQNGRPEALDVTITHSQNDSSHTAVLKDPEAVLKAAVAKKRAKYVAKLQREGILFNAFALDVYGQMHSDAIRVLERTASYAAANRGEDYVGLLRSFKIQMQAALAKQVVTMIQVRG